MNQKTVIITGGNSGLGYQCAKNIASKSKDYTIVIACRNKNKALNAQKNLKKESNNPNIYTLSLDLSSTESIRKSYDEFLTLEIPPLYGIVCNAGFNRQQVEYTEDGFEATFGALHLGHFLFTNLMLEQMGHNGRIVFVSSDMHNPPKIVCKYTPEFHNAEELAHPGINGELSDKELALRYPMAKLCNILCVNEMSDRLKKETDKNITVNAFNPGLMTDTNFMPENSNIIAKKLLPHFASLLARIIKQKGSGVESGKGLANLITEKQFERITRKYFDRNNETPIETSLQAQDNEAARKLWVESAELVNLKENETILSIKWTDFHNLGMWKDTVDTLHWISKGPITTVFHKYEVYFSYILNNFRCKKKQIENYGFRKCGTSMSETNLKEYFTDGQNIKREFDIIL